MALLLIALSFGMMSLGVSRKSIANRDFVEYWAAGQQLVHGKNPYNANRIFAIERSAGKKAPRPIIMFNPPSALFLTVPLGTIGLKAGYLLWSFFVLGAWLGSVHMIWVMNGKPDNRVHFIGYVFAPAIACFLLGQMAAFVLLGLTLFLFFHRTRPMLAGAALLLCALKPHLFFPFWIVFFSWAITRRCYRVLAGAATSLAIACLAPLFFNPAIYRQYAAMGRSSGVKTAFIPTFSEVFRIVIAPNAFWIQFLPAMLGCIGAFWYFQRHRADWDWQKHGAPLILLSLLVAPYSWYFDPVIALPSLLFGAYRVGTRALVVLLILVAGNDLQLLLLTPAHSAWYLWPGAAWLAWYLCSMRYSRDF
ncbi:MAG TPA: glycosyltransferase 87 family protein [Acidobacteriaceae bacterium]|nr:glycosyltransferase 87 family protein [Acidobacteriaceae bacterium]